MRTIDLNADVGEGWDDAPLLDVVTSINIACGGHAGDEPTMRALVRAARARGVAIGAHPGYADREHFGRRALIIPPDDVRALVADQVAALRSIAGEALTHVKPHGALYNQAAGDRSLAAAIAAGVRDVDPSLRLIGLAGSAMISEGRRALLPTAGEAFADRRYLRDGTLAPRGVEHAVIDDPEIAAAQAIALASGGAVATIDGATVVVRAETICVHGDTPNAVANARAVRRALASAGFAIAAL